MVLLGLWTFRFLTPFLTLLMTLFCSIMLMSGKIAELLEAEKEYQRDFASIGTIPQTGALVPY